MTPSGQALESRYADLEAAFKPMQPPMDAAVLLEPGLPPEVG